MYTNMSAKKRKIDCDQGQRRLTWGSGSLTVTDDPSATNILNEDEACEPQKRQTVTESWRSFGEILRQKNILGLLSKVMAFTAFTVHTVKLLQRARMVNLSVFHSMGFVQINS